MSTRAWRWLLLVPLLACQSTPAISWAPAPGVPLAPPGDPAATTDAWDDDEDELDATLAELRGHARAVEGLTRAPWVKAFARGTSALPAIEARTLHHDADKSRYLTAAERAAATDADDLVAQIVDTKTYYQTKYGSPLAYTRALDLVAMAGMPSPAGASVVDFGYGTIGHLRLLAGLGARTIGVDVDPFLRALYGSPGDQGPFGGGTVTLLDGAFPKDPAIVSAVGAGHLLWISKNVLKRGYIHPEQEVPAKQRIQLGVSDASFIAAVASAVKSGGFVMIYNITPPPNGPGLPYRTWADGRSPFARALWENGGFEVLAFDQDDSAAARTQGRALGWDADGDLETQIFAMYTLLRRK